MRPLGSLSFPSCTGNGAARSSAIRSNELTGLSVLFAVEDHTVLIWSASTEREAESLLARSLGDFAQGKFPVCVFGVIGAWIGYTNG